MKLLSLLVAYTVSLGIGFAQSKSSFSSPPIYLFERLSPLKPILDDSLLNARHSVLRSLPVEKTTTLYATPGVEQITRLVQPENYQQLTKQLNPSTRNLEQVTIADSILAQAADRISLSDSTRTSIGNVITKSTSLLSDGDISDLLDKEKPLATADKKLRTSTSELDGLLSSPSRILTGEIMPDSTVTMIREKLASSPVQDRPLVKEIKQTDEFKQLSVKERSSLLDRTYLEATVGIAPQNIELLQVVPTVGAYLTRHLSLGIGLDGILDGFQDGKAIVGLKSLAKLEILPRKLYLQAENTSYFSDLSYLYEEIEAQRKNLQVPYVGAGVLLDLFENKSLNLSLMHRFGEHPFFNEGNASWVFRLGMSFFPNQKKLNTF